MTWEIRPATRSEAKPLIGIFSESGCGKTWSSLMLARGFVGPKGKIVMLETEAGRGEVYADVLPGGYDVCSMRNEFSPKNYGEAITEIERKNPDALIIDSASHEWEGSGGVLAMAAQNEAAGKKSMMIWQGPKLDHQRYFVLRLLATPIPFVIVCMRAKYPMKEVKIGDKKEWVRADQVVPVQSDGILYELMIHGWIDQAHRFQGTKYTRDDLKEIIKTGESISIQTGARLAAWAKRGAGRPVATRAETSPAPAAPESTGGSSLFPPEPAEDVKPKGPGIPGVNHPDEREALEAAILAEKARLERQPTAEVWDKICEDVCGTTTLSMADPSALSDLLSLVKGLVLKDKEAIARVKRAMATGAAA